MECYIYLVKVLQVHGMYIIKAQVVVPIISTAISWAGECVLDGRSDGTLEYYTTVGNGSSATFDSVIFVNKGGIAYSNIPINITTGTSQTSVTTPIEVINTDASGKLYLLQQIKIIILSMLIMENILRFIRHHHHIQQ